MLPKILIRSKKRTITEYFIYIDGIKFNLNNLLSVLDRLDGYNIKIVDKQMIAMFKRYKVIKHEGTSYSPATKGSNFKKFSNYIENKAMESRNYAI